ncbi:50S ribosomal protein L17 [Candidatus Campbellbacteria bacterium CG11_big_fil_rev_8_21_14_0_20_44_21]|uniref:Large ribosomal subunit protein bL17 n=1 Tax=Candidatus Campbellbacteria bacterium CG22_combo_CG10-13_8_21_14_all_43_18 TaxID=1974530 RepID=A0A2H0DYG5_9BACT|nr:MAG: 50S ribosomal protein L17 [Candidatus Campbellbacteria bacterium CG22_combo_CG10-13_8_21_14_all_43_18]PIR24441.1 MAG: 50S ribosomal protein L17 [Candidatus Campbellbacteria bacterium CG11_big_fil_rev_8_21_14_0_20_44_21]
MRHQKKGKKFGREKNKREALLRSLALSLINQGKIKTTEAKAKALRPFVEKLITRAKADTLFSRRIIRMRLGTPSNKLFSEVAPTFKERNGGYTRIVKLGGREKDASPMAIIEFVKN